MSTPRVILILVLVLGGAVWALFGHRSPYLRFTQKGSSYYREFAGACDSLLGQHPVGTNDWVYRSGRRSSENSIRISPQDPSLPKVIRDVRPDDVILSSKRVWIGIGVGRGAFGIEWIQDTSGTNGWSLRTYAESLEKLLYQTTKFW